MEWEIEKVLQEKIGRFYSLIEDYSSDKPNTRYKSWEWCHKAFIEKKENYKKGEEDDTNNAIIDELSLHLGFYLASWGMYRGSSFLLQRDYKVHYGAVKEILECTDERLWDYTPKEEEIKAISVSLFGEPNNDGLYKKIRDAYKNAPTPSDTLVTKILMGTLGCIPALDRFFKAGLQVYQSIQDGDEYKPSSADYPKKVFTYLAKLAANRQHLFAFSASPPKNAVCIYPPMKCLDMCFWEIGYEKDLIEVLVKGNAKAKNSALEKAKITILKDIAANEKIDSICAAKRIDERIYTNILSEK